ncbi:unnamed protein product [Phaedon cochleariae]|uniref:Sphingomyelin phosphodiesterase n=1 Tax=Phaedon cochleariae TaxID=80249 RepID=A0A9N9SF36_PHACE|nr:unnamed protein product [Phaedon cochleariae]
MKDLVELPLFLLLFVLMQTHSRAEDSDITFPGEKPNIWKKIFDDVSIRTRYLTGLTLDVNQTCTVCHMAVDALIQERRGGMTDVQLTAQVDYLCSILLEIEDERVCNGLIPAHVDIFDFIVDSKKDLSSKRICGLFLQSIGCDADDENNFKWTIDIPEGNTVDKSVSDGSESFKVLHLTDIHYDPNYTEGKVDPCGEPLCCQSDQPDSTHASTSCGHWATYNNADSSMKLIEETLRHANETHDFDYVYFTGDLVSHRVWSTSIENNSAMISEVFDKFSEYFKVPVFPILGNHEAHPANVYAPEKIAENLSTNWLYKLALSKWTKWLSEEEVKKTILKGGYYTVQAKPGLRIIVLNNNVCSVDNWWLVYQDNDPYDQLKWLVEVLKASEDKKESVHILSHIPTASCLKSWAREYNRIIERFANTITGQFYGHTHLDQFYIYYGSDLKPTNVAWNGASVVADKANPNYKLYTVDSKNFNVLDTESWTFNLTKANENKTTVEWYSLYTMKKAFDLKSLDPSEMDNLVEKMATNHTLIDSYYKFYHRNSDAAFPKCTERCQKRILCEIVNTVPGDDRKCQDLMKLRK